MAWFAIAIAALFLLSPIIYYSQMRGLFVVGVVLFTAVYIIQRITDDPLIGDGLRMARWILSLGMLAISAVIISELDGSNFGDCWNYKPTHSRLAPLVYLFLTTFTIFVITEIHRFRLWLKQRRNTQILFAKESNQPSDQTPPTSPAERK